MSGQRRAPVPYPGFTVRFDRRRVVEDLNKGLFASRIDVSKVPVGSKVIAVYLVSVDDLPEVSREYVFKVMARNGLRPCTLEELVALDMAYPALKSNGNIAALGTVHQIAGYPYVPFLQPYDPGWLAHVLTGGSECYYEFHCVDNGFGAGWRFAAVCKD